MNSGCAKLLEIQFIHDGSISWNCDKEKSSKERQGAKSLLPKVLRIRFQIVLYLIFGYMQGSSSGNLGPIALITPIPNCLTKIPAEVDASREVSTQSQKVFLTVIPLINGSFPSTIRFSQVRDEDPMLGLLPGHGEKLKPMNTGYNEGKERERIECRLCKRFLYHLKARRRIGVK
ncbi:predicted protein [Sclerotinia sclerotiorum 1980 UF-70]|uniref:Uncharacterized protein n=1 Tax=Sclerotinia sclerotiorum (strain ATCC 18683 / 1980 / Ss-1) TaxID=665079 RepID=A7ERV3_SCLS1|nr:predicted protein [Sclerotinia sclerotiorum 1980 UF-70]EDN92195.1 predicted protein [Sclerotinia sclerotiorum 1980 UF-70]